MSAEAQGSKAVRVELGALRASGGRAPLVTAPFHPRTPGLARLGRCGGAALAVALVSEAAREGREPLVVAIGGAVRDGLPTAARATVAGRGPLTGLYAEGQVGSDLARRLASVTDALVIDDDRADEPRGGEQRAPSGEVLVVGTDELRLITLRELLGLAPDAAHRVLERELGPCASLLVGPAGERGVALASLAACSSALHGGPPHFVGRGGLGALLGRLGLKAVCVTADEPAPRERSDELALALTASPRLLGRAAGGTLELFAAHAARADLPGSDGRPFGGAQARGFAADIEDARAGRHGCAGCPTPCGWTFALPVGGGKQAARFAAVHALAQALGWADFGDALRLLERCDAAGLDAKETGAALTVFVDGNTRPTPDEACAWIDTLAHGSGGSADDAAAGLALGSERLARSRGRPELARCAKGSAVRADASLASLLGQCVSARGADPLRTFPFLATSGGDAERLARLSGLQLAPAATDPKSPDDKGRVVAWHEELACALDATGFCAFSAGALLADGVVDLDRLARWIAPAALRAEPGFERAPAQALLSLGRSMVLAQRDLQEHWAPNATALDRPAWARAALDQPGMWPEYCAVRGLDQDGRMLPATRAGFEAGQPSRATPPPAASPLAPIHRAHGVPQAHGQVRLRSIGQGRHKNGERTLELLLPAPLSTVLVAAAAGPGTPAVYRAGKNLAPDDLVHAGDELDLVVVVPGG